MKQLTIKIIERWEDSKYYDPCWVTDLYIDGKFMGTHANNSCGPYGDSTGIYAEAESTCPITEWAEKNDIRLFWYNDLTPVPGWL